MLEKIIFIVYNFYKEVIDVNIIDYIKWRGDLTMDIVPFNHLDALLFSQLSMLRLDEVLIEEGEQISLSIKKAVKVFKELNIEEKYDLGLILPKEIITAFYMMGESPRYKNLVLDNYVNNICSSEQTQFSALTIDLGYNTRVVSFSGTDDTLIGWKENFNMLFVSTTAGQASSCDYLSKVSRRWRHIYVCGHSKGANLALYSTLHVNNHVQRKIEKTIGFDGPGLIEDINEIDSFERIIKKVTFYVPDTTIIGALFDHYEEIKVVKSTEKGLYQHDVFSWEVLGTDFIYVDDRTEESKHIEQKIKTMISEIDEATRVRLVNEGYKILSSDTADTLTKLYGEKFRIVKDYLASDPSIQKAYKKIFLEILRDKIMRDAIYDNIKGFIKKQKNNKKTKE